MRPQDIPARIARLDQLSNGFQKEQADIIRYGTLLTREESEKYLEGIRLAINGTARAALALRQVVMRLEKEGLKLGG